MKLSEYPVPVGNNKFGLHWLALQCADTDRPDLEGWTREKMRFLRSMGAQWLKICSSPGGDVAWQPYRRGCSECTFAIAFEEGLLPIVRIFRSAGGPYWDSAVEANLKNLLRISGSRPFYVEPANEVDLRGEWSGQNMPPNAGEIICRNTAEFASRCLDLGVVPVFPSVGYGGSGENYFETFHRVADPTLLDNMAVAVHNYSGAFPVDWIYNPILTDGRPISQEEYDSYNPWCWDKGTPIARSIEYVNRRRLEDALTFEANGVQSWNYGFWTYQFCLQQLNELGHTETPLISSERGTRVGEMYDTLPRIDPNLHKIRTLQMIQATIKEKRFIAATDWLIANQLWAGNTYNWEDQAWLSSTLDPKVIKNLPWAEQIVTPSRLPIVDELLAHPVSSGEEDTNTIRVLSGTSVITLDVESYLKGVVTAEMSPSAPAEALKAQAVAARTYAAYKLKHPSGDDFDVYSNTNDQVWDVNKVSPAGDKAVQYTTGEVWPKGIGQYIAKCGRLLCPYCKGQPGTKGQAWPTRMCQEGAMLMAQSGSEYKQILTRYYNEEEPASIVVNKLGCHFQRADNAWLELVEESKVHKTMDLSASWCKALKEAAGVGSLIIGRAYVDEQQRVFTDAQTVIASLIQKYGQAAQYLDAVEFVNELVNNSTTSEQLKTFDAAQANFARQVWQLWPNMKVVLFNLPTGNWGGPGEWTLANCPLSMMLDPQKVLIGVHGYSWPTFDTSAEWYVERFVKLMQGFPNHQFVLNELGITHAVVPGQKDLGWRTQTESDARQTYIDGLKWVNTELNKYEQMVGGTIYVVGQSYGWDSFESGAELTEFADKLGVGGGEVEPPSGGDVEPIEVVLDPTDVLTKYNLGIQGLTSGTAGYRISRVRRVPVGENNLRQNLYVNVHDKEGKRDYNKRVGVKYPSGDVKYITLDKPLSEPMGNMPLWKGDTVSIWVDGEKSEVLGGLSTDHPDEGDDVKRFHFSFEVDFTEGVGGEVPDTGDEVSEEELRNAAWNETRATSVAYNPAAAFQSFARISKLGVPITNEFDYKGYRLQGYALGIVLCKIGEWSQVHQIPW